MITTFTTSSEADSSVAMVDFDGAQGLSYHDLKPLHSNPNNHTASYDLEPNVIYYRRGPNGTRGYFFIDVYDSYCSLTSEEVERMSLLSYEEDCSLEEILAAFTEGCSC